LINAIARDEIVVHLQPQIKISSNEWVGVEALARWQHPQLGLLFPDSFISLAEEPDISGIFTAKILELSLDALNKLYSMTGFNGTVSVNFPASALADVGMTDRIIEAVDRHGIDHSRLIVEITETSVPQNVGNSMDIEMRLRMREIKLSIDDFGTGFSSLERLHASPFDELKVDLIFVRESQRDPAARSIVENSIRLGHSLEMQVVAEGVEDDAILTWLKGCGCDIAQGYHISKPLAVDDLCKWAANR
jgi:diguanylate cyclase